MWVIVLGWLLGFVTAVIFVIPFVAISHVKGFAAAAAADIRGS